MYKMNNGSKFLSTLQKWSDCTKVKGPRNHPLGVCTRYRFYPDQKKADLQRVFEGIVSGRIGDIWGSEHTMCQNKTRTD